MIELRGQDDSVIFVKETTVSRIRAWDFTEGAGTKVDYAGVSLHTPEELGTLVGRLEVAGVPLVQLTVRNGSPVWINAAQVAEIRAASPAHGEGTQVRVGGKRRHVTESPADVRLAVEAAT